MRIQRTCLMLVAASVAISLFAASANAISVGNNPPDLMDGILVSSGPFGGTPSFVFAADIDYDAGSDALLKDFTQTSQGSGGPASGVFSGTPVPITETFTNVGTEAWSAWDEEILTTTAGNPPPSPGFLFSGTVTVLRNGVPLTQGSDYTLGGVPYFGGGNNGFISRTITLAPASYIQPTDTLEIQKSIHEVFNDGNVWALNEAAQVAQYPTPVPEPTVVGVIAIAALAASVRRRRAC
jgi:hypothetical protein